MYRKFLNFVRLSLANLPFAILSIVSIAVSIFLFGNAFELAANVDIPYAFAIEPVSVATLVAQNQADAVVDTPEVSIGNFGEPKYLKLATQSTKLALVPSVIQDGSYLARASVGHFVYLGAAKSGNLGNTLIYIRSSWRSVGQPEEILLGTNIFVDTNKDWRYMYRVSDVLELPSGSPFIIPDSTKSHMTLVFVNDSASIVRIVVADFVNLQNIQQ